MNDKIHEIDSKANFKFLKTQFKNFLNTLFRVLKGYDLEFEEFKNSIGMDIQTFRDRIISLMDNLKMVLNTRVLFEE